VIGKAGWDMKKAKQMQRRMRAVAPLKLMVLDEIPNLLGSDDHSAVLHRAHSHLRRPDAGFVASQAIMKFNNGKRVRFLGALRKADGSPLKSESQKFLPAQVTRQMVAA
jgi:hypothetical protein